MDGHIVHHLFFTKVPHYRLEEATIALQEGLADIGQSDLYKQVDTPDFVQEIVKQFDKNWFFIDEKQVVR
jgi:omega-3 fatty acid desaturase (delta-15 desaturase)